MPTSQSPEQPGDEKRDSDVPQPSKPKPEIREMENPVPTGDPRPKSPPEAV
jgi:hypothetical protein